MQMQTQKQTVFDGSQIVHLVESDEAFSKFVDHKFAALDISPRDGGLSRQELQPAVSELGIALGLPPRGLSPDSDHIYDEVLTEFFHGRKDQATISKADFASTLRDVLLGIADGLKRNPISVLQIDGSELRKYAESPEFEVDAVGVFSQIDSNSEGAIDGSRIEEVLQSRSLLQKLPPGCEEATKYLSETAIKKVGVDTSSKLDQTAFINVLKQILLTIASLLQEKPLNAAYNESNYDGSGITNLLRDKEALKNAEDELWNIMPKDHKGNATTDGLVLGLDAIAPAAGLPPMGAVDEMDHVYQDALKVAQEGKQGSMNQEEFEKSLLAILGSIMLQLQGKPITIKKSSIVNDEGSFDVLSNI
ncbi:hypothetical protein O6H91_20G000400 [Diphasiastrum complanatum]|uniref:Uncharacterized protein n=1 Tax=Diphasiastrum complanatum TaxID=34168 RepID=A0ACC2ANS9_DIPCM|nr:hypothetical protein O6H91_20G000400 [Diphasiastrum complanatum]